MRINRRTAIGLFGSAIAYPFVARAQGSPLANTIVQIGSMFRLDGNQTGGQIGPRLAPLRDGSGGFLATWTNRTPEIIFKEYVYARYFNAKGKPTSGKIKVRGDFHGYNNPPVAFADGTAMVLFNQLTTGGVEIFAGLLGADHQVHGALKLINDPATPRDNTDPLAARLANNNVAVAWSNGVGGFDRDCRGRIISATGTWKSADMLLPAETADDQVGCSIVALEGGGFVFAYQTKVGNIQQVNVQRYNRSGFRVGDPFPIYGDAIFRRPGLAALPDGGFVVFWTDYTKADQGVLKGRIFSKFGVAKPVFTGAANGFTNDSDGLPLVALTTDGRMLVISRADTFTSPPIKFHTRILASLYSAKGTLLDGPIELYFNTGVASGPNRTEPGGLFRLDDGSFIAAWSGEGLTIGTMRAFAMRLSVT